jgi:hypothetical protein
MPWRYRCIPLFVALGMSLSCNDSGGDDDDDTGGSAGSSGQSGVSGGGSGGKAGASAAGSANGGSTTGGSSTGGNSSSGSSTGGSSSGGSGGAAVANGKTGSPCTQDSDCTSLTDDPAYCLTTWTGGYCSTPCVTYLDCSGGKDNVVCESFQGEDRCLRNCNKAADCRTGYTCNLDVFGCVPQ